MNNQLLKTGLAVGLGLGLAMPTTAISSDNYPERTVEVINQFGPGGGTDLFIRAIGIPFSQITRQSLVGISVTGGGGVPAFTEFTSRPADGHNMMAVGPEEVINHVLGRIDITQLQGVSRVQWDQGLFYAPEGSDFENIEQVIEYARENPGELTIAGTGAAGYDETLVGLWSLRSEAELNYIPFDSAAEAFSAVLGGHTDLLFEEYGPARSLVEAGEINPLVVFMDDRLPVLPDVPTAQELGFDVTIGRWRGLAMHAEDDPDHAEAIYEILAEAAESDVYKNIEEQNALQFRSVVIGPNEFQEFLEGEIEIYEEVLGALGHL